jgi:hypothetical protein
MSKTLLIAAAALAGSVISSQAQVYSQNIVGYINVPIVSAGYTAVASQLDYDGTGTNNSVATVFGTNLVVNTIVYAWNGAGYAQAKWENNKGVNQWGGDTNSVSAALKAGLGVMIKSPATNNLTLVGTVLQGTNVIQLVDGYNLVSSVAPISGGVSTALGYAPNVNDIVYTWSTTAQGWNQSKWEDKKGVLSWGSGEPQISVGAPFFILTTAAETWTNSFVSQ